MSISEAYRKRLPLLTRTIFEDVMNVSNIKANNVDIPAEFVKETLNQKIWNGTELRPEVREKMLKIVTEYRKHLNLQAEPKAIRLVGSMANYNWTEVSDIDIHIFYNIKDISKNIELAREFLETKGAEWKNKHKISFRGYSIEMYAQDVKDIFFSGGVYDLLENKWVTKPNREKVVVDKNLLRKKIATVISEIRTISKLAKNDVSAVYGKAKAIKNKIKKMRQSGLESDGEYSIENLTFKYLRNKGYLEKLSDVILKAFDAQLSLDEKKVSMNENIKDKGVIIWTSDTKRILESFYASKKILSEGENKVAAKHRLVLKKSVDNFDDNKIALTKEFIINCCAELGITEPCQVFLTGARGGPITTTASYNPNNDHIWIYTKNRNMASDPMRSIAHEIRHFKQKLDGVLHEKSGETGSEHENEANSFSGKMIRLFGKKHPEIYL